MRPAPGAGDEPLIHSGNVGAEATVYRDMASLETGSLRRVSYLGRGGWISTLLFLGEKSSSAMAGGTFNHDTITSNIQRMLWGRLRGGKCQVYSSDIKVYISKERYFHPDVTVTCDPRDRGAGDLLQSPRLVVEVLSPSTELKDRTWKLQNYTAHPSIEEYLLVSSRALKIERSRKEQNKWVYYAFEVNDDIDLASLGVHFSVAEANEGIDPEEDFAPRGENETLPGQSSTPV